ncbi:MAG: anti-sigma factor [Acetobacteraceae bacterium]|nr:anti-sigma factor [Acetobacteraceae bacterium]
MSGTAAERDFLAAEYALGVLEGEERAEAIRLLRDDPTFAGTVTAWEQRLAPLALAAPPVPPPSALFARIAASTRGAPALSRPRRFALAWPTATAAALALAAGLAAFIVTRPAPVDAVAVLLTTSGNVPFMLALHSDSGTAIRPAAAVNVPADRDLELWSLPPGASAPHDLGVLPASGRTVTGALSPGTQLLVSLEPKGGSPSGSPTGPVLCAGALIATR